MCASAHEKREGNCKMPKMLYSATRGSHLPLRKPPPRQPKICPLTRKRMRPDKFAEAREDSDEALFSTFPYTENENAHVCPKLKCHAQKSPSSCDDDAGEAVGECHRAIHSPAPQSGMRVESVSSWSSTSSCGSAEFVDGGSDCQDAEMPTCLVPCEGALTCTASASSPETAFGRLNARLDAIRRSNQALQPNDTRTPLAKNMEKENARWERHKFQQNGGREDLQREVCSNKASASRRVRPFHLVSFTFLDPGSDEEECIDLLEDI